MHFIMLGSAFAIIIVERDCSSFTNSSTSLGSSTIAITADIS